MKKTQICLMPLGGKADSAADLLGEAWFVLDDRARRMLINALLASASRLSADSAIHSVLIAELDLKPSPDIFKRFREAWCRSSVLSGESWHHRRVDEAFRELTLPERGEDARTRLINLYREASQLQEQGNNALYAYLTEGLTNELLSVTAHLHGTSLVVRLLTEIIKDPQVEVVLSILGLGHLLHLYGRESLVLDDELLPSLLTPKLRGEPRISIIEALCDSFATESDSLSAIILRAVSSVMNEVERADVKSIVHKKTHGNSKSRVLVEYLEGRVSLKTLEKKLRASSNGNKKWQGSPRK